MFCIKVTVKTSNNLLCIKANLQQKSAGSGKWYWNETTSTEEYRASLSGSRGNNNNSNMSNTQIRKAPVSVYNQDDQIVFLLIKNKKELNILN